MISQKVWSLTNLYIWLIKYNSHFLLLNYFKFLLLIYFKNLLINELNYVNYLLISLYLVPDFCVFYYINDTFFFFVNYVFSTYNLMPPFNSLFIYEIIFLQPFSTVFTVYSNFSHYICVFPVNNAFT